LFFYKITAKVLFKIVAEYCTIGRISQGAWRRIYRASSTVWRGLSVRPAKFFPPNQEFNPMRRFGVLSLVASAAFFAVGFAVAQDDYLPLVQEETISIVRTDLSKLDGQNISRQVQKLATSAIDAFVNDKDQAKQAKETIPLIGVMVAQNFATYVKPLQEVGVTNVYFVIDQGSEDNILYPYFAIPTRDLSKEQVTKIRDSLKELNQALNSSIKYRFERNGYMIVLIIPSVVDADEAKTYARNRFAKFNTVEKPEFAEGFKMADPNAAVVAATLNSRDEEAIQKQLDNFATIIDSTEAEDIAEPMKNSINKFNELGKAMSEYVSFGVTSFNLDDLSVATRLQAKSADDAQKYVDLVRGGVKDEYSKMIAGIVNSESVSESPYAEDVKELEGILNELYDVFATSKVDGSVISWTFDEQFFNDARPTFDKVIAFATKHIEKIQAAADVQESDDDEINIGE